MNWAQTFEAVDKAAACIVADIIGEGILGRLGGWTTKHTTVE
jgi:hypothetical protein